MKLLRTVFLIEMFHICCTLFCIHNFVLLQCTCIHVTWYGVMLKADDLYMFGQHLCTQFRVPAASVRVHCTRSEHLQSIECFSVVMSVEEKLCSFIVTYGRIFLASFVHFMEWDLGSLQFLITHNCCFNDEHVHLNWNIMILYCYLVLFLLFLHHQ